ncbi:LOW QUALITY PROTEIN: putative malate dehydrogenase 1B [Temnothorax americanus]|uniref:LOW QUALITY PROTEIN: putative malate dehydrogenase 1B n=1 Tax=Temnothorax americanus TaxID=1964332 RepID=UPI0040690A2B
MSDKCFIVIAGTMDNLSFHYACFIAMNLSRSLPNFHFKKICKDATEWEAWIRAVCKLHGWEHVKPPLIWKQCGISGTKVTYIGDVDKFRGLLLEYYNIRFDLTREELELLKTDLLRVSKLEKKARLTIIPSYILVLSLCRHTKQNGKLGLETSENEYRRVTIVGAARSLCLDLIPQLMTVKELHLSRGIVLSLYDEPENLSKLERITNDIKNVDESLNAITIIRDISNGLRDCDILLFLEDITREECEEHDTWYQRNYDRMKTLSRQINEYASCHIKIVFCSMGATCLCATILRNLVAKLPETSIVVVSAQYGLEVIGDITESLGTDRRDFGCPPVWGFLGAVSATIYRVSQFVDVCHMVQKCNAYSMRNGDTLEAKESVTSKLLGVEQAELKWFCSFKDNKNLYEDYLRRRVTTQHQANPQKENLRKCRAICDLLKLWYKESVGDEIIALGISSDGSFGIPSGIVFSQPACLKISDDGTRVWVPCDDFPLPDMPVSVFRNLIATAVEITRRLMSADKV